MKPEYDINQTVWSSYNYKWVTIKAIRIDDLGIAYIDELGISHHPSNLSAKDPLITQEQFDKVWDKWSHNHFTSIKDAALGLVQNCIKEVQE